MNGTTALKKNDRPKEKLALSADVRKCFRERKKRRVDPFLLVTIIALVVVGLLSLASASHAYAYYHHNGNSAYYTLRQLAFACAGIALMMGVSFIPTKYYQQKSSITVLYIITIILLGAVYLFPHINGVQRWIVIGGLSFQPSEIAKFTVIVVGAYWGSQLYPHRERLRDIRNRPRPNSSCTGFDRVICQISSFSWRTATVLHKSVIFYLLLVGIIAALIVFETHLSCTIIILAIATVIIVMSGFPLLPIGIIGVLVLGGALILAKTEWIPYSSTRIDVWLNPEADQQGAGWQTLQSLYAIGSGGMFGQGITNSTQKHLYISEPQNDFIFAVICEEVGFVGAVMIIALFLAFVYRSFIVSVNNPDKFSKLLGVGISMQVGLQALLNIGVVTNSIPNTGISLPFFSYGGTSLLVLLAEMGVLLSVSRGSTAAHNKLPQI